MEMNVENVASGIRKQYVSKFDNVCSDWLNAKKKDQINQCVQQNLRDWLYQDSDDESVKLKDLKKLLDPIEKRYGDDIAKAKGTKAMMALIEKYRSATNSMPLRQKHMVPNVFSRMLQSHTMQLTNIPETSETNAVPFGLEARIDVAMAHSTWAWGIKLLFVGLFHDPRCGLYVIMSPQSSMRLVIRRAHPNPCFANHGVLQLTDFTSEITDEELRVSSHLSINQSQSDLHAGSAVCECR
ncbi:hypothetical protein Tco_0209567 [Tanacetum coccineum]